MAGTRVGQAGQCLWAGMARLKCQPSPASPYSQPWMEALLVCFKNIENSKVKARRMTEMNKENTRW